MSRSPDRPRLISGVWQSTMHGHTTRTAAVRVRRYSYTAGLAPVVPRGPDPVCQAGSASVTCPGIRGRRSSGVCAVLGPLLFAVCCSPVRDVIIDNDVYYHQYTDDTQLHLAMSADNTAAGLYLFLLHVLLTSDIGTCRTTCSSTRTSRRL